MKYFAILALVAPALAHADPDDAPADAAADAPAAKPAATAVVAQPKPKHWYVRVGGAYVHPFSSSREMELANVDGPASLAISDGPIAGSGATVDSTTLVAGTLGYRPGWLEGRLSFEIVLGPPLDVKFHATGTLANMSLAPTALGLPTGIQPLGSELGEAKSLPPLLTAVYALKKRGPLEPYIGAGATVLMSYDAHVTNPTLLAAGKPDMSIAPAPGVVVQAGVDVPLYKRWSARLDVKFIGLMLARAEVHHIQMQTPDIPLFGNVDVGTAKMSVWVNPLIVQAGIGTDWDF